MITIRNDDFAVHGIPDQQQRNHFASPFDFDAIGFDVAVANAEQRKAGRPENVFGFEV